MQLEQVHLSLLSDQLMDLCGLVTEPVPIFPMPSPSPITMCSRCSMSIDETLVSLLDVQLVPWSRDVRLAPVVLDGLPV
jgi:hypothetical protein